MNNRTVFVAIGLSLAVLIGCVATWIVMDARLRREKEELRKEMREVLKEGIQGAADEMLTVEYAEKKLAKEVDRLFSDPPVEAVSKTAEKGADAGVKLGSRTATGVLGAVKENEKEIRETGKAVGEAVRVGIEVLLEATRAALGSGDEKKDVETAPAEEE